MSVVNTTKCGAAESQSSLNVTHCRMGERGMGPLTGATDGIEQRQMVTSQVHNGLQYEKGTVGV